MEPGVAVDEQVVELEGAVDEQDNEMRLDFDEQWGHEAACGRQPEGDLESAGGAQVEQQEVGVLAGLLGASPSSLEPQANR